MIDYVGIDVSKSKLDCAWLKDTASGKLKTKVFKNTESGHHELISWLGTVVATSPQQVLVTLEPTNVYHEALAYRLYEAGYQILMANPGKAKAFSQSQNQLSKTDKKDSVMLARYGYKSYPDIVLWQPEAPEIRELKALMRRLDGLEKDLQREKNRKESAGFDVISDQVMTSISKMIDTLEQEIAALKKTIDDHIDQYPRLKQDRQFMQSVDGVGDVVSRELLYLFHSKSFVTARQVSAYVGLVPVQRESGMFKGKTPISKRGPSRIRAKLYMAAVSACQHNEKIKAMQQRLIAKGKTKMQALCAAMRKLLEICFVVVKHQSEYRT